MKYFKMLGLCLVAVLALGAVAAGSASAKTVTILFPNGGSKPNFSSIAGKGFLVQKSGAKIECESARNTGEAVPGTDQLRKVVIIFKECGAKVSGVTQKCNTSGQSAGTIKTFSLEGNAGYINESEKLVGDVLKAEVNATTNPNTLFTEFECTVAFKVKVRGKERGTSGEKGGIIAELLPGQINKLIDPGTAVKLSYKKGTNAYEQARQTLTTLGSTVSELLLESTSGGSGFELAGLEEETDVELFFLESIEISA